MFLCFFKQMSNMKVSYMDFWILLTDENIIKVFPQILVCCFQRANDSKGVGSNFDKELWDSILYLGPQEVKGKQSAIENIHIP